MLTELKEKVFNIKATMYEQFLTITADPKGDVHKYDGWVKTHWSEAVQWVCNIYPLEHKIDIPESEKRIRALDEYTSLNPTQTAQANLALNNLLRNPAYRSGALGADLHLVLRVIMSIFEKYPDTQQTNARLLVDRLVEQNNLCPQGIAGRLMCVLMGIVLFS